MEAISLKDFAEKLRVFRAIHNLSQVKLASILNVGFAAVANWERMLVVPTADNYLKALELFENYKGTETDPLEKKELEDKNCNKK